MQRPTVFVIAPFKAELQPVLEAVRAAISDAGFVMHRPLKEHPGDAMFAVEVLEGIRKSDLVLADVSHPDPNVLYELGFAHALRKPTLLLLNIVSGSDIPTDLVGLQYFPYDPANLSRLSALLKSEITGMTLLRSA